MPPTPSFVALVEDDERMSRALARHLRLTGLNVRTYRSAEAFLADTERVQASFLIADIQLGGRSGLDLATQLRAERPAIPVALITAHDEPDLRDRAFAAGCAAFYRKPFSGNELIRLINASTAPRESGPR